MEEASAERRLDYLGRAAFDRAVALAAELATQNVAAIHRKRLVTQASIAAFILALLVVLPVVLVIKGAIEATDRQNAIASCLLVKDVSLPLADFVSSDAKLRIKQLDLSIKDEKLTGAFQRLLGKSEYARLIRQSEQSDRETTAYWNGSVVPRLRRVAGASCAGRLAP